jgi:hypothetical protein
VAEGARLESVFTRKGNVGSNPTLSASSNGDRWTAIIESDCPSRVVIARESKQSFSNDFCSLPSPDYGHSVTNGEHKFLLIVPR